MSALAAPLTGSFFAVQSRTGASSADAVELGRRQLAEIIDFPARHRLLQEVQGLFSREAVAEWFGGGAQPAAPEALHAATLFVTDLPASFLDLEVSPDQDGGITLDWYRDANHQLSISFDRQGYLYYAAILGAVERISGRLSFYGSVPEELARILQRLAH